MTDKQIIIDGVDVSGCNERSMCINCDTVTNCYYKQLKRKEQECEELKEECRKYGKINEQETKDYAELKAKCKSLEEISGRLQEQNHNLTLENEKLEIWKSITPLGVKKLVQTLTGIKGIVKNMNEECFYGDFKCEDCDFKNGCTYQAKKQLKQKISEVINEEV